jgi:hypothetical protein
MEIKVIEAVECPFREYDLVAVDECVNCAFNLSVSLENVDCDFDVSG